MNSLISVMPKLSTLSRCVALAVLAATAPLASAGQIHVPGDHALLQDAINAAAPYDEIIVSGGVHVSVVINKPLSILAAGGTAPRFRSTNLFEFVCPSPFGCGPNDLFTTAPIRLSGPGSGTVILKGLQVAGTPDSDIDHSVFGQNPSGIEGGGFDELRIMDCTVFAPGSKDATGVLPPNHAVNVNIGEVWVMDSTLQGGSPFYDQEWYGTDLWSGGAGIQSTGDVNLCGSNVVGGDAAASVTLQVSATCAQITGGQGGPGVSTPGTVTFDTSWVFGGNGSVVYPWNSPTCTMPSGISFDAGLANPSFIACYTPEPSPCAGSTGPTKATTFQIVGSPSGTDWWWYLDNGGGALPPVWVPGVSGDYNGDLAVDELDLADAFADAINKFAAVNFWLDVSATTSSVFGSVYLSLSSPCQPSLFVSDDGVSFCDTSLLGSCAFNPQIQLVPLPGWDCNENGLDDQLDLAVGESQDLNGNGILDECEPSAWTDEGSALAGVSGDPQLVGFGDLSVGSENSVVLINAAPSALSALFLAPSSTPVAFMGGTLKAYPFIRVRLNTTSPVGDISLPFIMPAGLLMGTEVWLQWAITDAAALYGVSLSNAIKGVTP